MFLNHKNRLSKRIVKNMAKYVLSLLESPARPTVSFKSGITKEDLVSGNYKVKDRDDKTISDISSVSFETDDVSVILELTIRKKEKQTNKLPF